MQSQISGDDVKCVKIECLSRPWSPKLLSDVKPFICDMCGKCFPLKEALALHSEVHAQVFDTIPWGKCGNNFNDMHNVLLHLRRHAIERPYTCHKCQKKFSQKSTLQIHLRSHTGELPYECHMCDRKFAQKNALDYHVRGHTGECFECDKCEKKYKSKHFLKIHLKNHH